MPSRFATFLKKPYYAWRGFAYILRRESSFRFQLVVVAAVLLVGRYLQFSRVAWAVLLLAAASVLVVEVLNTVVERLLDVVEPRFSQHVALLKDLLAAAALIIGVTALVVALLLVADYTS